MVHNRPAIVTANERSAPTNRDGTPAGVDAAYSRPALRRAWITSRTIL